MKRTFPDDRHPPGRGIEVGRFGESDGASCTHRVPGRGLPSHEGQLGGGVLCDAPVSAHLVPGQTWEGDVFFSEKLRKEPLCIQRYLDSGLE